MSPFGLGAQRQSISSGAGLPRPITEKVVKPAGVKNAKVTLGGKGPKGKKCKDTTGPVEKECNS